MRNAPDSELNLMPGNVNVPQREYVKRPMIFELPTPAFSSLMTSTAYKE